MKSAFACISLLLLLSLVANVHAQVASLSPHGDFSLDIDCASCHKTDGWTPILDNPKFDHDFQTRFPLSGSHATAQCSSCHLDNRFDEPSATVTDCATCHIDVHQGSFAEGCVSCHNTTSFQQVEGIGIHAQTNFPLTGAHSQITCISCHTDDTDGAFTPLETACVDCHEDDYDASIIVDHVAAGFPLECETCHTDLQWQGALFDHVTASNGFDLVGSHQGLACASCHQPPELNLIFEPATNEDCISCHQDDYDDEHGGTGFPTTCLDCHNQIDWDDVEEIDHFAISGGFALIGAHQQVSCGSCHNIPDYSLIFHPADNSDCISCHQDDYDDEHAGSGFPTNCLLCHNQNDWDDAEELDHAAVSNGFALVGAHEQASCGSCHNLPDYSLIFHPANNQDCISCHQADYDDEHAGSGFPTTCLDCHNQNDWEDVEEVDHAAISNGFELVGAHLQASCASCHNVADYSLLFHPADNQDCISCHQADYDDEHAGTGTPTACLDCHNQNDWEETSFNHDAQFFPIFSGNHQDTWNNNCLTCHLQPENFAFFSCQGACHEHTEQDMNNEHNGVDGYVFEFNACLSCHPDGEE